MRENLFPYLADLLEKQLPFLLLRTANTHRVRVVSQRDQKWYTTAPDNMTYAVFSEFQKSENQVFIIAEDDQYFTINNNQSPAVQEINRLDLMEEVEQHRYVKLVEKAVTMLKDTPLKKVVLSRKQRFLKKASDLKILSNLLNQYMEANCYFFYHPQVGKWMGATPEVLLSVKDGKLQTMSLAGTAIYKENHLHHWGKKELQEQELVTDFIIDHLHKKGAKDIRKSEVTTVQAGNLIHLRTDISASVSAEDSSNFIDALHPTPAVCGMPRNQALKFILQHENYERSFYTGYLGIVDECTANYFVNLRCMQLYDQEVDLYVGGGVTASSNPQAEYEETVNKLLTMKKVL
ncbi:isochorismate synthase [Nonlabens sp.]|uniref:isochorismate synthase n=1 Tax=Nonlabens sp. TaxID=1888209 RepID=UPI001BCAAFF3|nr:isochorismate synthase [Nonlabens sp.]